MKKIIVGFPVALLFAIVLVIAWVNLTPEEDVSAKKNTEQVATKGNAKDYIKTAWSHWNSGAVDEQNTEKDVTFIALRSINKSEMIDLGVGKEFSELQKVAAIISGEYGGLTDEEKQIYYKEFEDKLYAIHDFIN